MHKLRPFIGQDIVFGGIEEPMTPPEVRQGQKIETSREIIYPWVLTLQLRWNEDGILEQRWYRERYAKDKDGERFVGFEFKWERVPGKSDTTDYRHT